ncbi:MAG: hypothetical protein WCR21_04125 [Bacteroidota bacterium]
MGDLKIITPSGKRVLFIFALLFSLTSCSDEQLFLDDLRQIAKDVNNKCPRMVDSETRLDGIEIKEPNTLVYRYTLVNANLLPSDTHQFYLSMWPGLISFIKLSKEMEKLRENATAIHYEYRDKSNKVFYTFKIEAKDYKKP